MNNYKRHKTYTERMKEQKESFEVETANTKPGDYDSLTVSDSNGDEHTFWRIGGDEFRKAEANEAKVKTIMAIMKLSEDEARQYAGNMGDDHSAHSYGAVKYSLVLDAVNGLFEL